MIHLKQRIIAFLSCTSVFCATIPALPATAATLTKPTDYTTAEAFYNEHGELTFSGSQAMFVMKTTSDDADTVSFSVSTTNTNISMGSTSRYIIHYDHGDYTTVGETAYTVLVVDTLQYACNLTVTATYNKTGETSTYELSSFPVNGMYYIDYEYPQSYLRALYISNTLDGAMLLDDYVIAAVSDSFTSATYDLVPTVTATADYELVSSLLYDSHELTDEAGNTYISLSGMWIYIYQLKSAGDFSLEFNKVNLVDPSIEPTRILDVDVTAYPNGDGLLLSFPVEYDGGIPDDFYSAAAAYSATGGRFIYNGDLVLIDEFIYDPAVSANIQMSKTFSEVASSSVYVTDNIEGATAYSVVVFNGISAGCFHTVITRGERIICLNYAIEEDGGDFVFRESHSISPLIPMDYNEAAQFCGDKSVATAIDGEYAIVVWHNDGVTWTPSFTTTAGCTAEITDQIGISSVPELYNADLSSSYKVVVFKAATTGVLNADFTNSSNSDTISMSFTINQAADGALLFTLDSNIIPGDVDGNGSINIIDVLSALRFCALTAEPTSTQLEAADVDGDSNVTVNDVVMLRRYCLGMISSFE